MKLSLAKISCGFEFEVTIIGNKKKNNLEIKSNKVILTEKKEGKKMVSLGSLILFQQHNRWNTTSLDQLWKQHCNAQIHFLYRKEICRPVPMATLASAEEPAPLKAELLKNSTINIMINSAHTPKNSQGKWMDRLEKQWRMPWMEVVGCG